jgi:hypothetical protein
MRKQRCDDDSGPTDLDELRGELARRAADIGQAWRTCRRPPCRRGRRCAARVSCTARPQRRELSPQKRAAIMANLYRRVGRMVAAAKEEPGDR